MDNTTLYIADYSNNRVVVIQPGSTTATFILGSGAGAISSQFNQPSDVFVTSTSVYVLDTNNYRVQRWSRNGVNGTTVAGITGSAGTAASNNTFGVSYGIYVDKYGFLYVSDQATHRVLRFPPGSTSGTSATVVAGTGVAGAGPSQLNAPYKAFVDDDLTMYIADTSQPSNPEMVVWGLFRRDCGWHRNCGKCAESAVKSCVGDCGCERIHVHQRLQQSSDPAVVSRCMCRRMHRSLRWWCRNNGDNVE